MIIVQNPDQEFAREIKQQLRENNGYCPCAIVKNRSTKCKCEDFRQQIKRNEPGSCRCGLWIAVVEEE